MWVAQAWDYDGNHIDVTISSLEGDDYIVHVTSDLSDPVATFKTAMSVVQEFIFKKRPRTISVNPQEMNYAGDFFNNRFVPGYEVDIQNGMIVLRLVSAASPLQITKPSLLTI